MLRAEQRGVELAADALEWIRETKKKKSNINKIKLNTIGNEKNHYFFVGMRCAVGVCS